ncbi:hypothetical protein HPC49_16005 [Pyxidicoccus fallax]|uniref:HNH nuclease domain-containing protein n=1 Tax=Pyxidicoccus fallax TaxID=394095 RepID=A0A848L9N4_9BACT|nr:hypothetical protein [Pyxidicoccus fallax]NMO14962.1 hypothetical protein [Pyxidicoccus fallax]NPC79723.1 hypothetical protein [Pyxidicoccus fallax]
MIRLQRGRATPKLAACRRKGLATLRAALRANPGEPLEIPKTYNVAKEDLWRAQHGKCCYCELLEQPGHNDVEHFRPKSRADRRPGSSHTPGYWWLTWTWKNLLFACANCNRDHKKDQFPLEHGCRVLKQGQQPPGRERPLLLDPFRDDPIRHIHFRPVFHHKEEHWWPFPRAGSPRGETTIRVLRLDRSPLLDFYKGHVRQYVRPELKRLRRAMRGGNRQQVARTWRELTSELLDVRRPLTALSYDALDHLVPLDERKHWRLVLPPPLPPRR